MIYELLREGRENATPTEQLLKATGLTRRELTKQVERERRNGFPICSSTEHNKSGYYMPKDAQELAAFCGKLKHRAIEVFKTRQALVNVLKQIEEQKAQEGQS